MNDEYALMNFLNGVFHLKGKKKITSVTVKNPEIALEKVARISGLSESDILRIKANIKTK
jgi:hypothetical protein